MKFNLVSVCIFIYFLNKNNITMKAFFFLITLFKQFVSLLRQCLENLDCLKTFFMYQKVTTGFNFSG